MGDMPILIGKPKIYPEKLINNLIKLFSTIPKVKAAYLAQVFIINSGIPAHPVIGIDMEGNLNDIFNQIDAVIKENMNEDECVDISPFNAKGLSEYFATINPFYKAFSSEN